MRNHALKLSTVLLVGLPHHPAPVKDLGLERPRRVVYTVIRFQEITDIYAVAPCVLQVGN